MLALTDRLPCARTVDAKLGLARIRGARSSPQEIPLAGFGRPLLGGRGSRIFRPVLSAVAPRGFPLACPVIGAAAFAATESASSMVSSKYILTRRVC